MRRTLALLLVFMLAISVAGCGTDAMLPTKQSQQAVETQPAYETVAETKQEDEKIGEEKAKQIALEHAKLKEADVSRLFVELDYDDGILRYEVDFHYGQYEYDYDIDAKTGKILSYDKDIDD